MSDRPDVMGAYLDAGRTIDSDRRWHEPGREAVGKVRQFASGVADYVETHREYESMDKRAAIISAVEVLLGDLGAAQSYMDTLGVRINLYQYDFGGAEMSRPAATEADYRSALYEAQRALMYAVRRITPEGYSPSQAKVVTDALAEVNRVLDIGRDEAHEQIAT